MALKPGTQLGPYEISAPLGAGGMGEVYRATDIKLKLSDENVDAPLPTAGGYFNYAFTDRVALLTRFDYFGIDFKNFDGELFMGNLRVQHNTFKNASLWVGYEFVGSSIDVKKKSDDRKGSLDTFSHGPGVGIKLRF